MLMMEDLCSFEADVKGIMFYSGREHIDSTVFSHVYFQRDLENAYHDKAFFVVLCSNDSILGHLSRDVAEAVAEIESSFQQHGSVKLLG